MSIQEIFTESSFRQLFWLFFFFFFPAIVPAILHIVIFRRLPIGNPIKDMKIAWQSMRETFKTDDQYNIKKGGEWDYYDDYDDYDGTGAHARPTVRHPKNRDRAHSGGAERFHDGGGQDS